MKPSRTICLLLLATLPLLTNASERPKNLILMIGDGMGPAQVKAYRSFADDPATPAMEKIILDTMLVGAVMTEAHGDPGVVTDSASSATAYATGEDTINGALSLAPDGRRLETILERAYRRGMATGLVSTSQVTHATPAAFGSHVMSRQQYTDIADQYFDNQHDGKPMIDVLLGGGVDHFRREDRDLIAEFEAAGYLFLSDAAALENASAKEDVRVLGLFAPVAMPSAIDRPDETPSLDDMTDFAIRRLSSDDDGFFLMVEGSQIDWAAHANDIAGVVTETDDFMQAVNVAVEFARSRADTLVVVTADHETGGLSLASNGEYRWDPAPLRTLTGSTREMARRYGESEEPLSAIVAEHAGFRLSDAEKLALDAAPRTDGRAALTAITQLLDQLTGTGWSTSGHTGLDVGLYACGPGSKRLQGVFENQVLGTMLRDLLIGPDSERQGVQD